MFRTLLLLILPLALCANQADFIEDAVKGLIEQFLKGEEEGDSHVQTTHTIHLPTGLLEYTAVTGTLPQFAEGPEPVGELFFTAYLKSPHDPNRPVTFIFNGGPGGSAMSMHIGGLGPRRILFPEEGMKPLPPYKIIDNPETILDITDLVMIDPIDTGYSGAAIPEYNPFFHGVEGDILSFAEFIRVFCTYFERWNSPKYLMGASYGTCRACGLAENLIGAYGIHLDGVILLSCALDFNTLDSGRDFSLPDLLAIPTYAATSWYHGRTMQDKTLDEVIEYARRFALEDIGAVEMQPTRLSPYEQKHLYQQLSDLIGIPVATLQRFQGRLSEPIYVREFMASDRRIIGGTDSRYIGDTSALAGEYIEDPSYKNFRTALIPSFMQYLEDELETSHLYPKYKIFSIAANHNWNWWTFDTFSPLPTRPNFMQRLRRSLVANPSMKVFIGSGYYDIRTPFAATEYSISRLELPEKYRSNFQFEYYEAGHGFIFDLVSLRKFRNDLGSFYGKKSL